jgi:nucleoside-diphosphate-sugar epimerase
MRVVVTGATGNVGTALLRRLARESDVDVLGIARRIPPPVPPYDGVEWHSCDVGASESPVRLPALLRGADAVVHLAWQLQPTHAQSVLNRTNVGGTRAVIQAALAAGVGTLVVASSVGAYAAGPKDHLVDESWPTTGVPGSTYSRDKSTVERMLDTVDERIRVVRLRPALIFQRDVGCELIRYFLGPFVPTAWLRYGRLPLVPGHSRLLLQAVHADDVAQAYLLALRGDAQGAFNIAAEPVLTPASIAKAFHGWTLPLPTTVLTGAAKMTWLARLQPVDHGWVRLALRCPLISSARAQKELGWRPATDAVTALRELLAGVGDHAHTASAPLSADRDLPGRLGGLLHGRLPGTGNPY